MAVRNSAGTSSDPDSAGLVRAVHLGFLSQAELEALQLVERRGLQREQVCRIDEVLLAVEAAQVAQNLIQLLCIDARLAEPLPEVLRVRLPLAQLVRN